MRVLVVTTHYSLPLDHSWLVDVLAESLAENHDVDVAFLDWSGRCEKKAIVRKGVNVFCHPLNNWFFKGALGKFFKWLFAGNVFFESYKSYFSNIKYDLVISFAPAVVYRGMVKSIKKLNPNASCYLILWDFFPDYHYSLGLVPPGLYRTLDFLEQRAYGEFDSIGFMSRGNVDYFVKNKRSKVGQRLEVLSLWGPDSTPKAERRRVASDHGERTFIFGGQLIKGRGLELLVDLAEYAAVKKSKAKFLIFGDGPERESLLKLLKIRNLLNIEYKGFVSRDVYMNILSSADVGLVFNSGQVSVPTYPSKAIDFFRASLPILAFVEEATDFGDILQSEIKAGFYSTPGNREKLFHDFDAMMGMSDGELSSIGENGYSFYKNNMKVGAIVKQILKSMEAG